METLQSDRVYGVAFLKAKNVWCPCEISGVYFMYVLQIPQKMTESFDRKKNEICHKKWHNKTTLLLFPTRKTASLEGMAD